MLDLIIRGGQVVNSEGVGQRDLGIQGDQIAAVALPGTLDVEAGRTIDATGKVVPASNLIPTSESRFRSAGPVGRR